MGIQDPRSGSRLRAIKVLPLSNIAMATSGSYRQFFESKGKRYSHIIDPRTGYPVSNRVVSATVLARSCAIADGLATALMVLGPVEGRRLMAQYPGAKPIIFEETENGELKELQIP